MRNKLNLDLFPIIKKKDNDVFPKLYEQKKKQDALIRWRHDMHRSVEADNLRFERDRLIGNLSKNIVGPHTVTELLNKPKQFKELFDTNRDKKLADRIIELDNKIRTNDSYFENREK